MSTTITIPTALERKIAGRAATEGKDVEQFALEALERATETPSLRDVLSDVREEIRAAGMSEEEVDARLESAVKEVRQQRRA